VWRVDVLVKGVVSRGLGWIGYMWKRLGLMEVVGEVFVFRIAWFRDRVKEIMGCKCLFWWDMLLALAFV
jgi:hypothetical protein